jgi:hypothetical protein
MALDLLSLFVAEDINYAYDGSRIAFTSATMKLYVKTQKGIESYPIDAILEYENQDSDSTCAVSKSVLLGVLDRLSLFISDFDVNGVYLNFTTEGVKITSKNNAGSETIPYTESKNFTPCVCLVSVDALKKQVNARSGDILYIQYGLPNALKFVDKDITHIVALLTDDDDTEEEITEDVVEDTTSEE